jgi:serine/threonine protein kinase
MLLLKAFLPILQSSLQDSLFIVIEYVEGGSLADMRKRYGPWPERLVAKYTAQLLEGLDFLHQQVTSMTLPVLSLRSLW